MESNRLHTPHLIQAQSFDGYPLEWDQIFMRDGPLAVEIGFGNGEFLVDWARRRPEWNFVGIDSSRGSAERLQKRTQQYSVDNVRIIGNDAPFCLRELFPNNSIQHIIMNFPDPWPKKRHKQRRMLQPNFIQTLGAVLANEGMFELVTDQQWLAQDCYTLFDQSNGIFDAKAIEKNPDRVLRTKYEKKWQDSGCDIYRLTSNKIMEISISRMLEDNKMPRHIIETEISPEQVHLLRSFGHESGKHLFIIKEVYSDITKESYMVRAITRDFDYQQVFYIVISKRRRGWLIKLDETCPVFRTPAVKLAVGKVGEMLSQG